MLCSGKSTLLETIADREIPIPNHFDIFHLSEEIPVSDMTPLECVMEVDEERYLNVLHSFGRVPLCHFHGNAFDVVVGVV